MKKRLREKGRNLFMFFGVSKEEKESQFFLKGRFW
jgi:hypothetical protein